METYLYIMFCKLFCKRTSARCQRVDGVINRNLAILMVEPVIDVSTTPLENSLTQKYSSRR